MSMLNKQQFLKLCREDPEGLYQVFCRLESAVMELSSQVRQLKAENELLRAENQQLTQRVADLEAQLKRNSSNSSKPPGSDEFVKPKSRRPKKGRASGGQQGHQGNTLKMSDTPDEVHRHQVHQCGNCQADLSSQPADRIHRHQVFDLPEIRLQVTEHQGEEKLCSCCGERTRAPFPQEALQSVQYGNTLISLLVYLTQYQLLPYQRTVELVEALCGQRISEGTIFNAVCSAAEATKDAEEHIAQELAAEEIVHVDETGMRIEGRRQWLHVVSTDEMTHYAYHEKRGYEATQKIGILPRFQGRAIHDFWKPYFRYEFLHGLCNAHHLRELAGITERYHTQWSEDMQQLLQEIYQQVELQKAHSTVLPKDMVRSFEKRYRDILRAGYLAHPPPQRSVQPKRGRTKQGKARNLLRRLRLHRKEVLAFMYDFSVPFENNLAERDLRMMKVRQKISGVFRSAQGAQMFCRIRGYISTARKQQIPAIDAVKAALDGNPFFVPQPP